MSGDIKHVFIEEHNLKIIQQLIVHNLRIDRFKHALKTP